MQNEPDYKSTLSRLEEIDGAWKTSKYKCVPLEDDTETIKRALLIADALMQEPSAAEVKSGVDYCLKTSVGNSWPAYITNLRNVMRAKLLEELDNGK